MKDVKNVSRMSDLGKINAFVENIYTSQDKKKEF